MRLHVDSALDISHVSSSYQTGMAVIVCMLYRPVAWSEGGGGGGGGGQPKWNTVQCYECYNPPPPLPAYGPAVIQTKSQATPE